MTSDGGGKKKLSWFKRGGAGVMFGGKEKKRGWEEETKYSNDAWARVACQPVEELYKREEGESIKGERRRRIAV